MYLSRTPVTLCVISPVISSDWICSGLLSLSPIFAATISCRDSFLLLEALSTSSSREELALPRYSTFNSLLRMWMLGEVISNLSSIRLSFHRLKRTDFSQFQICEREFFKSWLARPEIVEICQVSNVLISWSLCWLILLAIFYCSGSSKKMAGKQVNILSLHVSLDCWSDG